MDVQSMKSSESRPNLFVRLWQGWETGLGKFVGWTAGRFSSLGVFTAKRPVAALLGSLLIGLLVCIGWLRFRMETESDKLWVPSKGKAHDDEAFVKQYYRKSRPGASFYAQLKSTMHQQYGGDNALQIPVTWEMFQLHNKIMAISVLDNTGNPVGYTDLCYRGLDNQCGTSGYLNFWNNSFTDFITAINGSTTQPNVGDEGEFRSQVSQLQYPDGEAVSLLSVFGGTTFAFNPFKLLSAEVIASDYTMSDDVDDKTAKRWHDEFTEIMKSTLPSLQYTTATWITGSTVGEEISNSINSDMKLLFISIFVYILIAVLLLAKWDWVKTRISLALLGILVTALGMMSGWGWAMIFGIPFTPLQQLSPFILLGMGIDVVFILVKAYDIIIQRAPDLTLDQAFGQLMSTAGLSVMITLLASAVAFALGSYNVLNSVSWFSVHATMNTLMIMVLMVTLFIAMFVLNEKRAAKRYRDCCCCPPCAAGPEAPSATASLHSTPMSAPTPVTIKVQQQQGKQAGDEPMKPHLALTTSLSGAEDDSHPDENLVKKFFRLYYAPLLARWWVKVLVIAIFVAYAVVSFYGIYQIKYGQPLSDLAPDGSYLQDYDAVQRSTYYQQVGAPSGLYFRDMDVSDPQVQLKMLKALDMALVNPYTNASTSAFLGNWLIGFTQWVGSTNSSQLTGNCFNPYQGKIEGNLKQVVTPKPVQGCVRQESFYPLLNQYLQGEGNGYLNALIIRDGKVVVSKLSIMHTASQDNDKYASESITSIRSLEKEINKQIFSEEEKKAGNYVSFLHSGSYIYDEGDKLLPGMALEYFLLALLGVGMVTLLMLVNPIASLLMIIAVGLVDLYLFGELWILNVRFNQVSIINMIMATGLAVDYSVYFAQKFMTVSADGTRNGRMQLAMADTGSAVFLGGFTALCGTVPMAFSKSVIIRTFFKLIFGTIIFSLLVGLVLMPVVFSLVGPPPVRSAMATGGAKVGPTPKESAGSSGNKQQGAEGDKQQLDMPPTLEQVV